MHEARDRGQKPEREKERERERGGLESMLALLVRDSGGEIERSRFSSLGEGIFRDVFYLKNV